MDFVKLSCSEETKSLSGTQCVKQTGLNTDNASQDFSVKGSTCKMGMIKLSVKNYMSSLHTYMETPPAAKWDGDAKHATFTPPTSVSEMLKLCEADPVELLIDLGFGIDEPDICTKIPTRFIMTPSEAKGINTRVFLDAQKRRMEIENPNLCGRFRQLEVLEQVTSAFSSLLKDVHFIQDSENKNVKKSTLTQEKRKRIRQLLWKFSRQVKIVDENPGPCVDSDELTENQDQREPLKDTANVNVFRKRRHSTDQENAEVLSKEQLPTTDNENISPSRPETQLYPLSAPVKQYNLPEMSGKIRTLRGSKVLSKTFRKASPQNRLQPPDSFEMEEVQSFEEEYTKALSQDRISDLTRTSSCQSDSSGFQDDPPEPLPLKNLQGSSDSIDSQVTLHEKSNSSDFPDISEEYDVHAFAEDATTTSTSCSLQTGKYAYKSLSMNTENSDDIFQSFESHNDHADNMKEMDKQISEDSENEIEEINNGVNYLDGEPEDQMDQRQPLTPVSSEVEYPVYVTHYLSDIRKIHTEFSSETNDDQDYFGGHSRDGDMENMKKACQTYREKLLEIEQHLLEQQAGCFNILTSEEREKIRRLHWLRRDVLKEATELEFNLDERAHHIKEAISVQLEQVLEEQSRLYSELEFCDLEPENSAEGHSRNLYKSQSAPSTSTLNVPEEDPKIKTNIIEEGLPSQKIDFSTILQNIKKTFRSFNN